MTRVATDSEPPIVIPHGELSESALLLRNPKLLPATRA